MRIGFATIYSWRPHVEFIAYLANLVRKVGHEPVFLSCDGDLSTCYTRKLRNTRPDLQECILCQAGGIRSFKQSPVYSIGKMAGKASPESHCARDWSASSASTLGRFESNLDFSSPEFVGLVDDLSPATAKAFAAAKNWIKGLAIDAVVVFNGRIDVTRAIFEAAKAEQIPVASLERTWFGDGLQLLPNENCLGLHSITNMVSEWADKPLTGNQARKAAHLIATRFLRRNQNEWRAYNQNAIAMPWPVRNATRQVLLLPSSRNEYWGHPDWGTYWDDPLSAYDALMDHLRLSAADVVLRCHPNWGEKIGSQDGWRSEQHYTTWARQRGICVISSDDRASTTHLIEQADAVCVAAGSAALETAALGKQVIGIAPAIYQTAGIRDDATTPEKLASVKLLRDRPLEEQKYTRQCSRKNALRFAYTIAYRVPQYVEQVRCITPTSYVYRNDGDAERLVRLLTNGILEPSDTTYAKDSSEESAVLNLMQAREWEKLIYNSKPGKELRSIDRSALSKLLYMARNLMPRGDR